MATEFESRIRDNLAQESPIGSTAGEMFSASYSEAVRWATPITSQWFADTEAHKEASRTVYSALQAGQIDKSLVADYNMFGKIDYEGLLDEMNERGVSTTINSEEFVESRNEQMVQDQKDRQQVLDNPDGFWASAAGFAGMMAGGVSDPLYLATMPLGIGFSSTIMGAATKSALLNGVIEAGAGMGIWDFNEEHGGTYGAIDYATQVGGAAGVGFLLGGAGKAVTKMFDKKIGKGYDGMLSNQAKMAKDLQPGDVDGMVKESSKRVDSENLGGVDADDLANPASDADIHYQRGESIVGPGPTTEGITTPKGDGVADVDHLPNVNEGDIVGRDALFDRVLIDENMDDLAALEARQDLSRIDELQGKEYPSSTEVEELDQLMARHENLLDKVDQAEQVADVGQTKADTTTDATTPEGGSQAEPVTVDYGSLSEEASSVVAVRQHDDFKTAAVKALREGECAV